MDTQNNFVGATAEKAKEYHKATIHRTVKTSLMLGIVAGFACGNITFITTRRHLPTYGAAAGAFLLTSAITWDITRYYYNLDMYQRRQIIEAGWARQRRIAQEKAAADNGEKQGSSD
eukprot:TRINITY_DN1163_c0_g1_i5.p1 TRINITY_DN1163_c0_g1~~TRINITY_DN1163_c0_g1_i5.p1  ORF type:complete len:117 (-),score=25.35 TRINITY_DN1163_c0_g1_i5:45-395(-)